MANQTNLMLIILLLLINLSCSQVSSQKSNTPANENVSIQTSPSNQFIKTETKNRETTKDSFIQNKEPLPKMENARLVIKKKERILQIFDGEKLIKTYKIALGFASVGDKEKEGDGKTPEGDFYVFTKNEKSKFYLSLGLSYPNVEDAERGLKSKLITQAERDAIVKAVHEKKKPPQNTALGGEIYIHGGGTEKDWTWGCIALKNEEIKEIFDAVSAGINVKIEP